MAVKRNLFTNEIYIIDMSSLKDLHDHYPKTVFPSIWQKINSLLVDGTLYSHIEIYREITNTINPKDKLLVWSKRNKKIFVRIDKCQIENISIIKTKYNPSHWQNKMNRPGPWADPFLIAFAICEQSLIITQENKSKSESIPSIASQFGIHSLNLLELFQLLNIKL